MPSSPQNKTINMPRDAPLNPKVNLEALKSDVRTALINNKAFACPIAMRVAWHSSGTFDQSDNTGGSDGATMHFEPEISDPANAGLHIVRDMLHDVALKHPEVGLFCSVLFSDAEHVDKNVVLPQVSKADIWTLAGSYAIELMA